MDPFAIHLHQNKEKFGLHLFLFDLLLFNLQPCDLLIVVCVAIYLPFDCRGQLWSPLNLHRKDNFNGDIKCMWLCLRNRC